MQFTDRYVGTAESGDKLSTLCIWDPRCSHCLLYRLLLASWEEHTSQQDIVVCGPLYSVWQQQGRGRRNARRSTWSRFALPGLLLRQPSPHPASSCCCSAHSVQPESQCMCLKFTLYHDEFCLDYCCCFQYIAKALLKENERKRWSDPPPTDKYLRERQDEEIFQTARLIK